MYNEQEQDVVGKVLEKTMPKPIDTEGKIKEILGIE